MRLMIFLLLFPGTALFIVGVLHGKPKPETFSFRRVLRRTVLCCLVAFPIFIGLLAYLRRLDLEPAAFGHWWVLIMGAGFTFGAATFSGFTLLEARNTKYISSAYIIAFAVSAFLTSR